MRERKYYTPPILKNFLVQEHDAILLFILGIVPVACSELFRGISERKKVADKSNEEEYQVGREKRLGNG